MKTRTDLIHGALRQLGVLPMGQSPSAEEVATLGELVDSMIAELEARDIIYIQDIDTHGIEEKYFTPLSRILAWRAAPAFGAQNDAMLMQLGNESLAVLDEMDRIDVHWNGTHQRTMKSDYPIGCSIVNNTTIAF